MSWGYIILITIFLFLINAVLHLIQPFMHGFNKTTVLVFIWGLLLLVLVSDFWFMRLNGSWFKWIRWMYLIVPLAGGIGLILQLKKSVNPKWLDYSILGLDFVSFCLVLFLALGDVH